MFKKICILASLSQQSAIEESVTYELAVAAYLGKPRGTYYPRR